MSVIECRRCVPKLSDVCCLVLSRLIPCVESLDGIPEHLGRRIFAELAPSFQCCKLQPREKTAFVLFDRSYGTAFINSFCLSPAWNNTNLWLDLICLSQNVRYLYLDNCHLGTKHSGIFSHLGQLRQLVKLSLRQNHLSDDQIRSFTASGRFSAQSFLHCLDVSGNGYLSERCVKLITGLKRLVEFHCGDTGIAISRTIIIPNGWCAIPKQTCFIRDEAPIGWFSDYVPIESATSKPITMEFEDPLSFYVKST
ncbi:hypothetical protein D915_002613 [Fasciola hepatica]|uniref:Leucine-rich repeat-containing protein 42 n=1 Tax=Fasciola hepatica TaxID=6192 RepID=A0A2H1CPG9_FASHE|nr:hypothetical protein D915_002613 [Fasciola hepatica]